MGREQRRAQQRAERRQQRQQGTGRQKSSSRSAAPAMSTSSPSETARRGGGGLLRPRWAMDIISELKKVTWPSRREVMNLTVVVIVVSLLLGMLLGTADLGFGWLVEQTILR